MQQVFIWVLAGTGFTFLMTTLGAASVFLFHKRESATMQRLFLGFAAGIMIAASVWSLLIPALEAANSAGQISWIPAAGGFALGVGFLMILHALLPHLHPGENTPEGLPFHWSRSALLVTAITMHNIPEGISIGLLFSLAAEQGGDPAFLGMAVALVIGVGIQNIPEGAGVAIALKQQGVSTSRAFALGSLSGLAEPVFGLLVVFFAAGISPFMPWVLAFAAGAMMYVVVEELIPEAHLGERSNIGTFGVMIGFVLMMILDVALG